MSPDGRYLRVDGVSGAISIELGMQIMQAYEQLKAQHGVGNVLLDYRGGFSDTSVLEKYSFAYQQADEHDYQRTDRVALLRDPDNRTFEFLVTVMTNNGFTVKLFDDEEQAISWLSREAQ